MPEHILDRVIWNSLTTRQCKFAHGSGRVRAFRPEFNILAAVEELSTDSLNELFALPNSGQHGLLFPSEPQIPAGFTAKILPLVQMECSAPVLTASTEEIVELGAADVPEITELTTMTRPGPWRERTIQLGRYIGIRKNGQLAAMAGERMRVPGYTEVSAVCTHPDHTGNGYAAQLMSEIMRGIFSRGERTFLHVLSSNDRAIKIYERLGFKVRKEFWYALMRKG